MIRHHVVLIIEAENEDNFMSPSKLKKWIKDHFHGCDYGTMEVREITTEKNGEEIDYKCWPAR
jgi:hypothetical protein